VRPSESIKTVSIKTVSIKWQFAGMFGIERTSLVVRGAFAALRGGNSITEGMSSGGGAGAGGSVVVPVPEPLRFVCGNRG
jgi:hypothetical protein